MEIGKLKNKLLDSFNIERVMSEEEVKAELDLLTRKRVAQTLSIGVIGLGLYKFAVAVSPMIDGAAKSISLSLKSTAKQISTTNITIPYVCSFPKIYLYAGGSTLILILLGTVIARGVIEKSGITEIALDCLAITSPIILWVVMGVIL